MNLGFKDQFCPLVEDGSKRHTIRAGRGRWKAGMRADLFARPRQKGMRLMFRAVVTRVETIEIRLVRATKLFTRSLHVVIDGNTLVHDELNWFLWRDGFRSEDGRTSVMQAADFWMKQLGAGPFIGQVIHWDYKNRFMDKPRKARKTPNREEKC